MMSAAKDANNAESARPALSRFAHYAPNMADAEITAQVLADDPIPSVSFAFGDDAPISLTEGPYTLSINPTLLQPGDYPLTVAAMGMATFDNLQLEDLREAAADVC